jgi:parvulin-like peptidyl-prolyl isomerase
MHGLAPKADPRGGRNVALNYEETLIFARKAVETGLDKDPAWQALLEFKYQQALYSIFKTSVKQKANAMSDAELKSFYDANQPRFEEFKIIRIFVPKAKEHQPTPGSTTPPKVDSAAEEKEMEALAKRIRAEAVAGGDFDRLQAKVSKLAGQADDPPDTDLGEWTRDSIPEESKAVIDLKPGQVSQPIPTGDGWQIVKLVSKRMVPWGPEGRNKTLQMIVADQANAIRKFIRTDLNNEYFSSSVPSKTGTATD